MINDSMKSQPHRVCGFLGDQFLSISFYIFFRILVSMATNENEQWVNNHMYDKRLRKEYCCVSFVKIAEMAWY